MIAIDFEHRDATIQSMNNTYRRFVTLSKTTLNVEISICWIVHIYSFEVGSSFINVAKVQPTKLFQFQFQNTIIRRVIQFSLWMLRKRKPLDIEYNWILSSKSWNWNRNWEREKAKDKSIVLNDQITTIGQKR